MERINDYLVIGDLGAGTTSLVKKVIHVDDEKKLSAMKVINRKKINKCHKEEVDVLKKLSHPNVCKLHEVIDDNTSSNLYFIMDLIEGGHLQSKLDSQSDPLTPE